MRKRGFLHGELRLDAGVFTVLALVGLTAVGQTAASGGQTTTAAATPPSTEAGGGPTGTAPNISVQARLVSVPVVVRDKKGALLNGLGKDEFTVSVAGKPQTIRYFDHDTDVPLTLGLLVDVSMSQRDVLDDERTGSKAFLNDILLPAKPPRVADKAFIVQFAHSVELLQDVTDARPRLESALREVGTSGPSFQPGTDSDNRDDQDSEGRRVRHGGTALYDAVFLASDEVTGKHTGRRALVLLTDGVDNGSKETLAEAIESAQRADTIVYAIYYKGQEHGGGYNNGGHQGGGNRGGFPGGGYPRGGGGYPGGGGGYPGGGGGQGGPGGGGNHRPNVDGKQVLERLCGETGGKMFEVSKKNTVEDIYKQIGDELRAQYRLGISPDETAAKDGYHQIDVAVVGPHDDKKLNVQTRDGYYVGAER
jgi:VWFA-related protein